MLQVAMLTTDYLPNIGGIAAHVHNLSVAINAINHSAIVINPFESDNNHIEFDEIDGVHIVRIGVDRNSFGFRSKPYRKRLFSAAAIRGVIIAEERFGKFDVIHQHDFQDTTYAANKLSRHYKWVWTNHSSRFLEDYSRRFKMAFVAHTYRNASGMIGVSRELQEKTNHIWPKHHCEYIPNGVNTKKFHPNIEVNRSKYGLESEDLVVLCPRRMVPKNGVIYLAKAIPEILKDNPNTKLKFIFLGSEASINTTDSYINEIKEILSEAYKLGKVIYLGNIPMEKMPEVNALADIVMMPSLMEAVSLSALEGMAAKKSLVVSNVGGLPEIIHDQSTGLLVEPRQPFEIKDALSHLENSPELKESISIGGYNLATKNYSWLHIADKTTEYYQTLIS